jgi:hypothetical protein
MNYNGYEISLKMDDVDFNEGVFPGNYALTLSDSIFNPLPVCRMQFSDQMGLFQEALSFTNGSRVDLTYGLASKEKEDSNKNSNKSKTNFVTCPFHIVQNGLPDSVYGSIGGMVEMDMVHHFDYVQTQESNFYEDNITGVVNKVLSDYEFNSLNIAEIRNKGIWYRPLMSQIKFINEVLLPHCSNTDSNNTPYYFFIDINNDVYLTSYKKMFYDAKEVTEIILTPNVDQSTFAANAVYSVNRLQKDNASLRSTFSRILSGFDSESGYLELADTIKNYPKGLGMLKVPIKTDLNNLTNHLSLYDIDSINNTFVQDNNTAIQINTMRDSFHIDKLFLSMPLNINLRAGKKVKLVAKTKNGDEDSDSITFSGEYLVERSFHRWNGKTGNSMLVISRKFAKTKNSYALRKLLV